MERNQVKNGIVLLAALFCGMPIAIQADDTSREAEVRKMYENAAQKHTMSTPTIIFVDETNARPEDTDRLEKDYPLWIDNDNGHYVVYINKNSLILPNFKLATMADDAIRDVENNMTIEHNKTAAEPKIRELYKSIAQKMGIPKTEIPAIVFIDAQTNEQIPNKDIALINDSHLDNHEPTWIIDNTLWFNKAHLTDSYEALLARAQYVMTNIKKWWYETGQRAKVQKIYENAAQQVGIPDEDMPEIIFVDENNLRSFQRDTFNNSFAWTNDKIVFINTKFLNRSNVAHKMTALHEMTHVLNKDCSCEGHCVSDEDEPYYQKFHEWRADLGSCKASACELCIKEHADTKVDATHDSAGYMTKNDFLEIADMYKGKKCEHHSSWSSTFDYYNDLLRKKIKEKLDSYNHQ